VYEARRAVKIPVIGLGGIESAQDVLEYLIVGATAVQIGTASFADPQACLRIVSGLEQACSTLKIQKISNLTSTFVTD